MGIIVESQSVVSDVVCRVARFLHGPDRYGFNQVLFLLSLYVVQQMIDRFRYIRLGSACAESVTKACDELSQIVQFLRIRKIVDTVRQHFGLFTFGSFSYLFRYGTVGKQHKLFYQLIGVFGFLKVDADGFPFFVDLEFHFVAVDGPCRKALFTQSLGYGVKHQYFVFEVAFFGFDDLLRLFVSEAAVRFDDRVYNA